MHANYFFKTLFLVFLLAPTSIALAKPTDHFDAGILFFTQGNYDQALEHFKRAEKGGIKTAQMSYNLGSVYYKVKQYELSKRYFEKLTHDNNLHHLAYYNLALIEYRLGRNKSAIKLFEISARSTDDTGLKTLADKQIKILSGL
jgi:tetratricopeptide (TPR) repeat protein